MAQTSCRKSFNVGKMRDLRRDIYLQDNCTCQVCGWRPPNELIPENYTGQHTIWQWGFASYQRHGVRYWQTRSLELDHIIPFSRGGQTVAENLRTICDDCNRRKFDKIPDAVAGNA